MYLHMNNKHENLNQDQDLLLHKKHCSVTGKAQPKFLKYFFSLKQTSSLRTGLASSEQSFVLRARLSHRIKTKTNKSSINNNYEC
jgi:hypothetical protein